MFAGRGNITEIARRAAKEALVKLRLTRECALRRFDLTPQRVLYGQNHQSAW